MASASAMGTTPPHCPASSMAGMPPLPAKAIVGSPALIASSTTDGNGSSREVSANTSPALNQSPTSARKPGRRNVPVAWAASISGAR